MRARHILLLLCSGFFLCNSPISALAEGTVQPIEGQINGIVIKGNERIEIDTILSYLGIREKGNLTQYDIDRAMKNLYATGFFADVKLYRQGRDLAVEVVENPIINRVAFEGNDKVEDKDLEAEVELKPRAIYTRTKVQNDVKRILDIYRRGGRYSATVEPKVIPLDQNRVDLAFEIKEGPVATVEKIYFVGNEVFDADTLRKAIRTSEGRWYKFFSSEDKYDPDRLQFDQELLRRYYASLGYPDFQVKSAVAELTPNKDAFYITFAVEEGKQYSFGTIDVQSSLKGLEVPDFKSTMETKEGETYNAELVDETIDAMTKELGNSGYAFVDIAPKLDRKGNTINLTYTIKEGPRVYVERINIHGNVRTLDEVIRREFRVAEGDPYSTSKLARTEQRLNNLGFFDKVNITNEPGSSPDRTVIDVGVEEKSTGEISLGAGFSTTDGALADVGIRETNLLGRGQDLKFRVLLAAERQQYDMSFTEPYFLGRELSAGFDIFKIQQDLRQESSYDRDVTGFSLRSGYALAEKWQHSLIYTLRDTRISNVRSDASRFVRDQEGSVGNSSVGQSFIYENRNNRLDPTDGEYLKVSQEFAGVGGDTHYVRHEVKGAYYYPIAKKWTVQLLGSAGHVAGLGEDVRINDRFYLGGDDLRGFETAGVGPRDVLSPREDALGGNVYYSSSAELRFPLGLPEELGFTGAAFVDAGSLWDVDVNGPEVVDAQSVRVAAGIGLAWVSPFGPIRIDLAHPLIKEDEDKTEFFRFSFGTRF